MFNKGEEKIIDLNNISTIEEECEYNDKIKKNKNIEKNINKRKYIENNNIKMLSELIPDMTEIEKKYIIKNNDLENFILENNKKKVIQKILNTDHDIEIIYRNFLLLNTVKFDSDLVLLYFNLKNNNIFIVLNTNDKINFFDLNTKKSIIIEESLNIINDLIDINKIIACYLGYLLKIKK